MAEGKDTPDLPRGLIDRRGTPLGKGTRLPSIRGPRDLTLGGIPKKVFTPNIPVRKPAEQKEQKDVKEKDKNKPGPSEVKPKIDKNTKPKPSRERSSDRGRGRNKGHEIIQSHSIFEQGPSNKTVAKSTNMEVESVGGRFHSNKSTSSQKITKKETKEDTSDVLDYLLRDDFIDASHKKDRFMEPVHLPLAKLNLKLEEKPIHIKEDPDADVEMVEAHQTKSTKSADNVLEALTKSEPGELLFFQFPDCMPGTPVNRVQSEDDKEEQNPKSQKLSDFSEGSVGKLVIRKSGRAQLVMGNITMDVSMGTKCGFLQDVVSIHTNDKSGDLSLLGHIKHRLVCTPDFDRMLNT